ncbi:hypothetical protein [Candidatus Nesciobacter abundans]|uniref:Uncharacterized protein n=1 Tax=Candidatus Nesciobacter abundans TaxID=2601668 RepID=A0A5C0UI32_9PROT|nr:hypothetical protein [Candidatus Nesciobacter abundans]QEK39042.1 hypothetical protein FZC36_01155 [Candidatus Nesciobacter abundans]
MDSNFDNISEEFSKIWDFVLYQKKNFNDMEKKLSGLFAKIGSVVDQKMDKTNENVDSGNERDTGVNLIVRESSLSQGMKKDFEEEDDYYIEKQSDEIVIYSKSENSKCSINLDRLYGEAFNMKFDENKPKSFTGHRDKIEIKKLVSESELESLRRSLESGGVENKEESACVYIFDGKAYFYYKEEKELSYESFE